MDNQHSTNDRIIREPECRKITGLCRMQRYNLEKKGMFPTRRQLGGRSVGWIHSEVQEWIRNTEKQK